jgi:hypothetical protein
MTDSPLRTPPEIVTELTHFFVLPRSKSRGLISAYERHSGQPVVPGPASFAVLNRVVGWHAELSEDAGSWAGPTYSALMSLALKQPEEGADWIDPRAWEIYDQLRAAGQDRTPGLWPALSTVLRLQPHVLDTPLYVQLVIHTVTYYTLARTDVPDLLAHITPYMTSPRGVLYLLAYLGFPSDHVLALRPLVYGDCPRESTCHALVISPTTHSHPEVHP